MRFAFGCLLIQLACAVAWAQGVTYAGGHGPGNGKHIVMLAGDDGEYHSEEMLPQFAKILSVRHGFQCTVLFPLDPDGTIDPHQNRDLPGLEALKTADLLVLFMRWRDLPDNQVKMLIDYAESGRPILAIRTGTHPLQLRTSKTYRTIFVGQQDSGMGRRLRAQDSGGDLGSASRAAREAEHACLVCARRGGKPGIARPAQWRDLGPDGGL